MRKTTLSFLIGFIILMFGFGSIIIASTGNQGSELDLEPRYVFTDNFLIRAFVGEKIRHSFDKVFSADLSRGQLRAIEILGIKTEPVSIFIINTQCRNDKDCGFGEYCDKTTTQRGLGTCAPINGGTEPEPEPTTRKCFPLDQTPWGIKRIYNNSDISSTTGGAGIKVAVLDTGVMQEHLDLKSNIIACESTVTRFPPDRNSCEDGHGHGTHVAGTILADGGSDGKGIYGIAPEAKLIAIKVCDRQGRCYGDDIAAGINYAVDNNANIISMSLGGSSISSLEKSAIDNAVNEGVLVIAAAGNSGPNLNTINYPAAYYKVVSVAATDSSDTVADFSSRGIDSNEFSGTEDRYMELAAPGVRVESTNRDGCYVTWSGTSMATPHVSGLAAKLWQENVENVRLSLQNLTEEITKGIHARENYDPASGFGLPVYK